MNIEELAHKTARGLSKIYGADLVEQTEKVLKAEQTRTLGEWFQISHFVVECAGLAVGLIGLYKDRGTLTAALSEAAPATPNLGPEQRDAIIQETVTNALTDKND